MHDKFRTVRRPLVSCGHEIGEVELRGFKTLPDGKEKLQPHDWAQMLKELDFKEL